jgi:DNA polymerase-1
MKKTILLIDAYAQIYRGFYALPPMNNSKGVYTNAIFAFSRFLLNLEKNYSPEFGAVVFDLGKCKARLDVLPGYKANRAPMPDELRSQLPFIREVVKAFGYPLLEHEGSEADDLIGALAKYFTDYEVKIISSDKDIAQVIDDRIEMLIPGRKGGGFDKRGVDEVFAKFAVSPDQIVDYLSLIGDSSDNIPGIAGVGPKTAAMLIDKCGTIQAMLDNPDLIEKEKLRNKIIDGSEILKKNIKLITLDTALPDESWQSEENITKKEPAWEKIANIAEELELRGFLKDLKEYCESNDLAISEATSTSKTSSEPEIPAIEDEDDLFFQPPTSPVPIKDSKKEPEQNNDKSEELYTPDLF